MADHKMHSEGHSDAVPGEHADGAVSMFRPRKQNRSLSLDLSETMSTTSSTSMKQQSSLLYRIEEIPPWYLCFLLGFQVCVITLSAAVAAYFILTRSLCIHVTRPIRSQLLSSMIATTGCFTIIQGLLGIRLPIVEGISVFHLSSTAAVLSMNDEQCLEWDNFINQDGKDQDQTILKRLNSVRGAIIASAIVQVVMGLTGAAGLFVRYMTPITLSACTLVVGLSFRRDAVNFSQTNWLIASGTIAAMTIFSQYLRRITIPLRSTTKHGITITHLPIFQTFSIAFTLLVTWGACAIWNLSISAEAQEMVAQAPWFRYPWPEPWQNPEFQTTHTMVMLPAVLVGSLNSVSDYVTVSGLCGVPQPPQHALNRGYIVEGLGNIVSGYVGTGGGMSSVSENVASVAATKVASRMVTFLSAMVLIAFSFSGKLSAFILSIPTPVLGGIMCIYFGILTSLGVGDSAHVNLASPRNVFVLGISSYLGLMMPEWTYHTLKKSTGAAYLTFTGHSTYDQFLTGVFSNSMFVGGFTGYILDMIVPGSRDDRGVTHWRKLFSEDAILEVEGEEAKFDMEDEGIAWKKPKSEKEKRNPEYKIYDIPLITGLIYRIPLAQYIPFLPPFLSAHVTRLLSIKNFVKKVKSVRRRHEHGDHADDHSSHEGFEMERRMNL